jgi:hypothetical protein
MIASTLQYHLPSPITWPTTIPLPPPPQAVEEDSIDMLAVQAPDCRVLPQFILDLLSQARTNLLIYHVPASQQQPHMTSTISSKALEAAERASDTKASESIAAIRV